MLFRVKICGVTTPDDAELVAAAGADAIGLNFVAGSPRRLDPDRARAVAAAAPPAVLRVGVFAGTPGAEILRIARAVGLQAIQIHGHLFGTGPAVDPPARCAEVPDLPVIRAVRLAAVSAHGEAPTDLLAEARRWLAEAASMGPAPALVLVDAAVDRGAAPERLGGTGDTVDWDALAATRPLGLPLALAGGLTPANVAAAISASKALAVDTASGVESSVGRKDAGKLRDFVAAARAALSPTAKTS